MDEQDGPSPYANPNVRWILTGGSCIALAEGILWFAPTWLIYALGGDNTRLGLTLGLASLLGMAFSVAASRWADHHRTDRVLWLAGGLLLAGMLVLGRASDLTSVLVGMSLSQAGFLTLQPTAQALLTNSVSSRWRNRVFGSQFLVFNLATALASLLLFGLFKGQPDRIEELDTAIIRFAILLGGAFAAAGWAFNLLVRDRRTLEALHEGSVATEHQRMKEVESRGWAAMRSRFAPGAFPIILLSLTTPWLIGFGAGLSVPYFPRFFFDEYGLDLADLSLVFAGLTVLTALWGKVTANLADRFGRVEMVVVNQLVAVALLYALSIYPPLLVALGALLLRNALMNGAWPVASSLQMEYAPRPYRSQLSALSFNIFIATFALGQMAGGSIADRVGFWLLFLTTATLYLTATLIYYRLRGLIRALPPPGTKVDPLLSLGSPTQE